MIENEINKKIKSLNPDYFEVINESHQHSGPGLETHFKLLVVSSMFVDHSLVNRHRKINELLKEELDNGVHALALHLYTPTEWKNNPKNPKSPKCMGGSKNESF
jgi:BolA protein